MLDRFSNARAVHPHARGDNWGGNASSYMLNGPPPRAWGQRDRWLLDGFGSRSTPTRVGTTVA